jgi:predicted DCC family thiol-disulfide oxidoreductase YuxK
MRPTVLYDDDCGFCRWSAAKVRAWDRRNRLAIAPIQGADELLTPIAPGERLAAMHVVEPDGRVWTGGAALTRLAGILPGAGGFAILGRALPGLAEDAYRLVATRRSTLGRLLGTDACAVDPRTRVRVDTG